MPLVHMKYLHKSFDLPFPFQFLLIAVEPVPAVRLVLVLLPATHVQVQWQDGLLAVPGGLRGHRRRLRGLGTHLLAAAPDGGHGRGRGSRDGQKDFSWTLIHR